MKLTGKCKTEFENWFQLDFEGWKIKCQESQINLEMFFEAPFSMQYGVYVDFFDSIRIYVMTGKNYNKKLYGYSILFKANHYNQIRKYRTKHKARTEAIKKANEIYNNKL